MSKNQRIHILGANGFIGQALHKRFSEGRYEVRGFSTQTCNLLSIDSIKKSLGDLNLDDVVVIAAAITRLKDNSFDAMMKNIQMMENLVTVLGQKNIRQCIYLSSVDVYGCLERKFIAKGPTTEQFALKPDDHYGIGKVAGELILRLGLDQTKTALAILRMPGVFGPGDQMKSLIGNLIKSIVEQGKITITGDGQDRRDYLYTDDLYGVVEKSILHQLNDTVNVVSGRNFSIVQIAEMLQKIQGPFKIEFQPIKDSTNERIKNMDFNNAHLRKMLPDAQVHDLSYTIGKYCEQLSLIKR